MPEKGVADQPPAIREPEAGLQHSEGVLTDALCITLRSIYCHESAGFVTRDTGAFSHP